MTTFQAVVYAIVGAVFEFIPVPPDAIYRMVADASGWAVPMPPLRGAIQAGLCFAVLIAFRHDFLSLISSFLQVILLRRKPRSIDEKLPFLILASIAIPGIVAFATRDTLGSLAPLPFLLVFAFSGLVPWFFDSRSKRNKNHYDWNGLDAILLGIGSTLALLPAVGRTTGAYLITSARHYAKDGATKFILFVAAPMLGASAYWNLSGIDFNSLAPLDGMTWLSFWVAAIVAFVIGLISVRSLQERMKEVSLGRYAIIRVLLAVAFIAALYAQDKLSLWLGF